ncbi:ATP-grasp domain-containing protein [Epibacterium sp. DP7N7-1]|nr:ATP-grasp domain-containing protein [Epibacterium sp. DP7N7-1]
MKIWYTKGLSNTAHAIRLLREGYGSSINLMASHTISDVPIAHVADQFLVEPTEVSDYPNWVLEAAIDHEVDMVIAQRRPDLFADYIDAFESAGIHLQLSADPNALRVMDQKDLFGMDMEAIGLPYPEFEVFKTLAEFDQAKEMMIESGTASNGFCVKPTRGIFGSGFRALRDEGTDMQRLLNNEFYEISTSRFRDILAESPMPEDMLLMHFLPGVERSVDFLCRDGEIMTGISRLKQKGVQILETEGYALELAGALARHFGLNGICNMQTRENSEGEQFILEVNPRMSGGMQMSCLAGVNLPAWNVALALDLRPDTEIPSGHNGLVVAVEGMPVIRGMANAAK